MIQNRDIFKEICGIKKQRHNQIKFIEVIKFVCCRLLKVFFLLYFFLFVGILLYSIYIQINIYRKNLINYEYDMLLLHKYYF